MIVRTTDDITGTDRQVDTGAVVTAVGEPGGS